MVSQHHQPWHVPADVTGPAELDVSAKRSEDRKTLVRQVVNPGASPVTARLNLNGFTPARRTAGIQELAAPLAARNTADQPRRVTPTITSWPHGLQHGTAHRTFPPHSFTVLKFD